MERFLLANIYLLYKRCQNVCSPLIVLEKMHIPKMKHQVPLSGFVNPPTGVAAYQHANLKQQQNTMIVSTLKRRNLPFSKH